MVILINNSLKLFIVIWSIHLKNLSTLTFEWNQVVAIKVFYLFFSKTRNLATQIERNLQPIKRANRDVLKRYKLLINNGYI